MSKLVAIGYDSVPDAQGVLETLGRLATEHSIELDDAVIVERKADGKLIQSSLHSEAEAAVRGEHERDPVHRRAPPSSRALSSVNASAARNHPRRVTRRVA